MSKEPSNTREQCAWDGGVRLATKMHLMVDTSEFLDSDVDKFRDQRNPHKKGSKEREFWNAGFDSVTENGK